jgi:hypothetical protein
VTAKEAGAAGDEYAITDHECWFSTGLSVESFGAE